MGWDKGCYYTRSRKVGGRVVREYVGKGALGELAAREDDRRRRKRAAAWAAAKTERAELDALDAPLGELNELADLLARAALLAAGYHQHKRQWRKKRGRAEEAR